MPLRVRFRNPETGNAHERETIVGMGIDWALENDVDPAETLAFSDEMAADREARTRARYATASIVGEEMVTTPAGEIAAVHLTVPSEQATAHFWISPDVPGMIVKITSVSGDVERLVAELIDLPSGGPPPIDESKIVKEVLE